MLSAMICPKLGYHSSSILSWGPATPSTYEASFFVCLSQSGSAAGRSRRSLRSRSALIADWLAARGLSAALRENRSSAASSSI